MILMGWQFLFSSPFTSFITAGLLTNIWTLNKLTLNWLTLMWIHKNKPQWLNDSLLAGVFSLFQLAGWSQVVPSLGSHSLSWLITSDPDPWPCFKPLCLDPPQSCLSSKTWFSQHWALLRFKLNYWSHVQYQGRETAGFTCFGGTVHM